MEATNTALKEDTTMSAASSQLTAGRLPIREFIWGAGIECSFIPHLDVDQFAWTQHDRFWKDDFRRAREELGIRHLRYALPWHAIEGEPGRFEWGMADERIGYAKEVGIELLMDVMHFGTPRWLKQAVGDPLFPESLERFAGAMVERYRGMVSTWCPFNEPLVSALFSGDFGFWPPHSRKWRGYMPVLSRIVQGVSRGIAAIRKAQPEATVLLCDAAENYKTRVESLKGEVARRNLRRFLVMDLLTGRVDQYHPLYPWLAAYGMTELDLAWFRANPQVPDVLGLDYYPHSDWQLDMHGGAVRQARAQNPVGFYGVGNAYYNRYGIPLMLTETSIEGQPINREIWLETNIDHIRRLREEGVPVLGLIWWPMLDQVDWDGALLHRVGKIHEVGLWNLKRVNGVMERKATPLVEQFAAAARAGEERVGKLERIVSPSPEATEEQLPPIGQWLQPTMTGIEDVMGLSGKTADPAPGAAAELSGVSAATSQRMTTHANGNGNGNGHAKENVASRTPATMLAASVNEGSSGTETRSTDRYGIVVFSHLRWGFVWQRPQQFLSRFAKKHPILFIEEPFFDRPEGTEGELEFHRVMPNVTVACPHCPASFRTDGKLASRLREWAKQAIEEMNDGGEGEFDRPLLWYYSPMDSAWSLGHFENRGVVYDCMDELSQFTGAPKRLIANEARLIEHADIVFTGGYELGAKKKKQHDNVHTFGCGVEVSHFGKAMQEDTQVPPDIDFMPRPILGWFGVVDERVDYNLIGEVARMRPGWSIAMVGPVVKVDPNLLPHFPNLFWLGGRDYQVLPNYCKAFDVCMMPFALNKATEYINPTKGLEYMATGRPIVGTHVKDVVNQWSDIMHLARNTPEDFVAACERALDRNNADTQARIARGLALAGKSSWEVTVATMQELIRKAISSHERRSGKGLEAIPDEELVDAYQHTQGS
jgi:beta-glucosidase/6-phospho-beta-glucosidase/beta-galactosidase